MGGPTGGPLICQGGRGPPGPPRGAATDDSVYLMCSKKLDSQPTTRNEQKILKEKTKNKLKIRKKLKVKIGQQGRQVHTISCRYILKYRLSAYNKTHHNTIFHIYSLQAILVKLL